MGMMRVGFVGLGNMGLRMAANLLKHGHQVVVNDVRGDVMTALEAQGASVVSSPGELSEMLVAGRRGSTGAGALDVVMTMLPSSASVEEVYCGSEGLLTRLPNGSASSGTGPGMLMIDASTISPGVSKAVASEGKQRGVHVLDAPVSGGVVGAAAGTLTFMVGGERASYDRAESLLAAMGKKSVYCGEAGSGQAVKLCNNLALAIQMASIAESMALGQSLGLDLKVLSDVMNMSSARCWSSDTYNPCPGVMDGVPSAKDYEGGFGTSLMIKDIKLALESAGANDDKDGKGALPMGSRALELYEAMATENAHKDFGGIYKYVYNGKPCRT